MIACSSTPLFYEINYAPTGRTQFLLYFSPIGHGIFTELWRSPVTFTCILFTFPVLTRHVFFTGFHFSCRYHPFIVVSILWSNLFHRTVQRQVHLPCSLQGHHTAVYASVQVASCQFHSILHDSLHRSKKGHRLLENCNSSILSCPDFMNIFYTVLFLIEMPAGFEAVNQHVYIIYIAGFFSDLYATQATKFKRCHGTWEHTFDMQESSWPIGIYPKIYSWGPHSFSVLGESGEF